MGWCLVFVLCVFRAYDAQTFTLGDNIGFLSGASLGATVTAYGSELGTVDASCGNLRWNTVRYRVTNSPGLMDNISFALYESTTPLSTPLVAVSGQTVVSTGGWRSMTLTDNFSPAPTLSLYGFVGRPEGDLPSFWSRAGTGYESDAVSHDIADSMPATTGGGSLQLGFYFEYECCEFGSDGASCYTCSDYGDAICPAGETSFCCEGNLHDCSSGFIQSSIFQDCVLGCSQESGSCVEDACASCPYGCHVADARCYEQCEMGADCPGPTGEFCCSDDEIMIATCENLTVTENRFCQSPEVCVVDDDTAASSSCAEASSKATVPAIIGGVIGGLGVIAFIVVVVVLVVVFRLRGRSSSSKKGAASGMPDIEISDVSVKKQDKKEPKKEETSSSSDSSDD